MVSSKNLEFSRGNTLYAPTVQKNWQFANDELLSLLTSKELTLIDFTDDNGELILSLQFFNSDNTLLESSSEGDLVNGFVASEGLYQIRSFGMSMVS